MRTLIAPLRVRSTGEAGRKVTWLELFFDLIFVAAVAQVAEPLRDHYSAIGLVRFAPLFALVWWAWTGHTVFSTRFHTDDVIREAWRSPLRCWWSVSSSTVSDLRLLWSS